MRKLFYFLVALPLVFAACENEPEGVNNVKEPVLKLTSEATMEVTAKAGNYEITYTLENKKEGVEVVAASEATWVADFAYAEGKVTFNVAANEGEARETKITVKYDTQSFDVTVKQAAKTDDDGNEDNGNDDGNDDGGNEEVKDPVLTLTSKALVEFEAAGGKGEITYTLENPAEGVEVTATCEAKWVAELKAADGKVTFNVAANEGEARETKIVVAYGEAMFEVEVKQAAAEPVIPAEPTAFTPVRVEATLCSSGNFILSLYVTEGRSHDFDLYDKVNPNEYCLSNGTYTSEDGSVGLEDSDFYLADKNTTCGMASANLTLTLNEETWEMTIKGEFASEQGHKHTIDWTGEVEGFDYPTRPVGMNITEVKATMREKTVWNLELWEFDEATEEENCSRLTVQLAEANNMFVTDGTYSVENGGILLCNATNNANSMYRIFTNSGTEVIDANLTVAVDKENSKAKLSGYIKAGVRTINFSWDGEVDGFRYEEIGEEGITEWKNFYMRSQNYNFIDGQRIYYANSHVVAKSAEGVRFDFYINNNDNPEKQVLVPGTYPVAKQNDGELLYLSTQSKVNNVEENYNGLTDGSLTVERNDGTYTIKFDITDVNGDNWKGAYTGEIPYTNYVDLE